MAILAQRHLWHCAVNAIREVAYLKQATLLHVTYRHLPKIAYLRICPSVMTRVTSAGAHLCQPVQSANVQAAMEAALRQREWQVQKFPGEAMKALRGCGSPEWLVAEAPRHALLSAAQSVIRWGHGISTCGLSDTGPVTF